MNQRPSLKRRSVILPRLTWSVQFFPKNVENPLSSHCNPAAQPVPFMATTTSLLTLKLCCEQAEIAFACIWGVVEESL